MKREERKKRLKYPLIMQLPNDGFDCIMTAEKQEQKSFKRKVA
jgi:hypothetical protein